MPFSLGMGEWINPSYPRIDPFMPPYLKRWLPVHDKQYKQLRQQNELTEGQIAKAMGFSRVTLRAQAKRLGLDKRPKGPKPGGSFKPERDAELIRDSEGGMATRDLCAKYALGSQRVNQIRRRFKDGKVQ